MEQNKQKLLKASELQMEKVANKLFEAEDKGNDLMAYSLRCKLAKLAQRHGELLEKFEARGRNVKQQIVLENYGFNIEFFVEKATEREELTGRQYEKFENIKIYDKTQQKTTERSR